MTRQVNADIKITLLESKSFYGPKGMAVLYGRKKHNLAAFGAAID
jgi:hypothetical protein